MTDPTSTPDAAVPDLRRDIRKRLLLAQAGSCGCGTNTDDITFHDRYCLYRVLQEAYATPRAERDEAQPVAVDETAKAEGMDEAADFVLEHLAKALGLTTFEPQEGTETWDGDVVATLNHILIAAGVVDGETGSLRILHPEHSAVIDAAAKYAEQRRIGRLFTDQDVLDACAALDRARTGSEAQ